MMEAFAELAPSPITFERIERKLDGAVLGKPAHVSVVVEIAFEALGRSGTLGVILPQMALDRLRPKLMRIPDDTALADPHWAQRFEAEIGRASASLTAVIEGDVLTLADVAGLQIGQVIGLKGATHNRVKLLSNDQTYFRGELGQDNGSYTVRIEEVMNLDTPLSAGRA
jgi:flagellar motor switch protein FliM